MTIPLKIHFIVSAANRDYKTKVGDDLSDLSVIFVLLIISSAVNLTPISPCYEYSHIQT